MKSKFINIIASSMILGYATTASGHNLINKHSVGVDLLKTSFNFKQGFGTGVFGHKLYQVNLFGQYSLNDVCPHTFVEYGYFHMQSKKNDIKAGYVGNILLPNYNGFQYNSKITAYSPYIGLGWNYKFSNSGDTYLSLIGGVSLTKLKARYSVTGFYFHRDLTTFALAETNHNKMKPAALLKVALNHGLSENLGVRVVGMWHQMSHFKIKPKVQGDVELQDGMIKLKNYFGIGVGLFYNF